MVIRGMVEGGGVMVGGNLEQRGSRKHGGLVVRRGGVVGGGMVGTNELRVRSRLVVGVMVRRGVVMMRGLKVTCRLGTGRSVVVTRYLGTMVVGKFVLGRLEGALLERWQVMKGVMGLVVGGVVGRVVEWVVGVVIEVVVGSVL